MSGTSEGFLVTETIEGAHPQKPRYPLLRGDLMVRDGATWAKEAPGLAVTGFHLTPEQEATLTPTEFHRQGLDYTLTPAVRPEAGA